MLLNLAAMTMANCGILGAITPEVISNATVVNDTVSATSTGAAVDEQLSALVGGFSSPILGWILRFLHIDPRLLIPILGTISFMTFAWQYVEQHALNQLDWFMCTVQLRPEDEIYAIISSWIAAQPFAQKSKSFVVNSSSFNSRRFWDPYWWWDDRESEEDQKEKRALFYTPAPGNHYFWYQRRLLIFRRTCNREGAGYMSATEREDISISCFGRDPWVLKKLLHDAYVEYNGKEDDKTLIYRGVMKHSWGSAIWQKSISKASRPFNTIILNEKVKEELLQDIKDYLSPTTRRWYANRGIPYRRGYLLHGPPGTGKSSLSLALAGYFKMRIYIVSLSSIVAAEENLSNLFADLPRKCIVLLEDIDTAGLTHTREGDDDDTDEAEDERHGNSRRGKSPKQDRLSLSGLLNILDGVASQEGRILIMTTNHVEKLDKALIRPGRVDIQIKFDRADKDITASIFRAIYGYFDNEQQFPDRKPKNHMLPQQKIANLGQPSDSDSESEDMKKYESEQKEKIEKETLRINKLAAQFAEKIPADTFSPAELQGYLLKNKGTPEKAIEGIEQWCKDTIKEREEKEKNEAEKKKKREEKRLLRKEKKKKKREERRQRKAKARGSDSESDGSDSDSDSAGESEEEKPRKRKMTAKAVSAESESESGSDSDTSSSEEEIRKKRKSKGKTTRKATQGSSSESSSEEEPSRRKKTKRTKKGKSKKSKEKSFKKEKASKENKPAKEVEQKTEAAEVKVVIEAEDSSDSTAKVQHKSLLSPSQDTVKGEADSGYETPSEEGSVSNCRVVLPGSPSPLQEVTASA